MGKWSGRGDTQTESFDIDSTQWRIKWETKGAASPGAGSFHLVVHSAVSGRPIAGRRIASAATAVASRM